MLIYLQAIEAPPDRARFEKLYLAYRGLMFHVANRILQNQQDAEDALLERLLHQAQATANDFCRTDFDADAPEPVRLAVLLMASHFYEYRDASDRSAYLTMMNAFHALLYPYRKIEDMF